MFDNHIILHLSEQSSITFFKRRTLLSVSCGFSVIIN